MSFLQGLASIFNLCPASPPVALGSIADDFESVGTAIKSAAEQYRETAKAKWFDAVLEGHSCQSRIEEDMEERWPFFYEMGFDNYDGSIELHFSPDAPDDFAFTKGDMDFFLAMGIRHGWANFSDGTEIYFHAGGSGTTGASPGVRQKVSYPRGSVERWNKANE